ncbi:hypothetical protein [Oryzifoliimicrobium ureilyticus]|uniref:hypothetical protein n=1 Tax=Oryzifoliimicrobium ureilyticus TaxID=3113724 RepID=UPI0030763A50
MRTTATAAIILIAAATPVLAISRYNPKTISCDRARAAIHEEGAVIFGYNSPRGLPIYGRYVRNSRFCEANEYAGWTAIPTKDDPRCPVLNCQRLDDIDSDPIVPLNNL